MPTLPASQSLTDMLARDLSVNVIDRIASIDRAIEAIPGSESNEHLGQARDHLTQAAAHLSIFWTEVKG